MRYKLQLQKHTKDLNAINTKLNFPFPNLFCFHVLAMECKFLGKSHSLT